MTCGPGNEKREAGGTIPLKLPSCELHLRLEVALRQVYLTAFIDKQSKDKTHSPQTPQRAAPT